MDGFSTTFSATRAVRPSAGERASPQPGHPATAGGAVCPSVLFARADDGIAGGPREEPAFFRDLNLDQIIGAVTAKKETYDLKPFFYRPLGDADAIGFRQEVMHDLEDGELLADIRAFAHQMQDMRAHIATAGKLYDKYQREIWFLDAAGLYCTAVARLQSDLSRATVRSPGLTAVRGAIADYGRSERFMAFAAETARLKADLATVKYCLRITGSRFQVRKYDSEIDYGADVTATFQKFQQGSVKNYEIKFPSPVGMNHIEAKVLDFVAKLHPAIFRCLDIFCEINTDYIDPLITTFDREIQFYISYIEYIEKLKMAGLPFCYPDVTNSTKEIHNHNGFDMALAAKLVGENTPVVCNDFDLRDQERILIVTGPNQGGKTTFARTFGQLHYLAALGCPVPGTAARLFLFDRLFTHFERQEDARSLHGKLEDDLIRIHDILDRATPDSIVIMNEIFTSTTLRDAIVLSRNILEKIMALDLLCVCVTFIDELSSASAKTVSMVGMVHPDDPTARTYKVVRRSADGLAYALSIAEKYRLTYRSVKERIRP